MSLLRVCTRWQGRFHVELTRRPYRLLTKENRTELLAGSVVLYLNHKLVPGTRQVTGIVYSLVLVCTRTARTWPSAAGIASRARPRGQLLHGSVGSTISTK